MRRRDVVNCVTPTRSANVGTRKRKVKIYKRMFHPIISLIKLQSAFSVLFHILRGDLNVFIINIWGQVDLAVTEQ